LAPTGRDPTPAASGAASDSTVHVDDPSRLTEVAGAFSQAIQTLREARSRFAAGAQGLGADLGDARLASRYDEVYQRTVATLDAIGHCFEEFSRALSSAGSGYEETDSSVAGRMR
jgi:uncharacterized protein YukE